MVFLSYLGWFFSFLFCPMALRLRRDNNAIYSVLFFNTYLTKLNRGYFVAVYILAIPKVTGLASDSLKPKEFKIPTNLCP